MAKLGGEYALGASKPMTSAVEVLRTHLPMSGARVPKKATEALDRIERLVAAIPNAIDCIENATWTNRSGDYMRHCCGTLSKKNFPHNLGCPLMELKAAHARAGNVCASS